MNTQIIYFQFRDFHVPFTTLQSISFKFFAKIIRGSCVFCYSSCISFNPTNHFNCNFGWLLYILVNSSHDPRKNTLWRQQSDFSPISISLIWSSNCIVIFSKSWIDKRAKIIKIQNIQLFEFPWRTHFCRVENECFFHACQNVVDAP